MAIPKINNHHDKGSNKTNSIPIPSPIKHIAIVFLNSLKHIILLPPLYIILICYVICSNFFERKY